MRMAIKQVVTAEDLWELPEKGGLRYELVEGEVVEVPGAGALHSLIVLLVSKLLDDHVSAEDLGLVLPDGSAYILSRHPDLLRIPDVSFISWERVPEDGIPEGFWTTAPDLAVEVVSPHDRAEDIHDKVHEYLNAGCRLVWVLWPRRRSVSVHSPDEMRELGPEDILDGADVLPGFQIRVADLFAIRRARRR